MLKRSRGSFLATARWVLAVWVALVASSALAPCKEAFALPRQGDDTAGYAATKAPRHAHHGEHIARKTGPTLLGLSHCIETVSPRLSKITTVSAPACSDVSWTTPTGNFPFFEPSSVPRLFTARLDARPRVFLKTSRLLI